MTQHNAATQYPVQETLQERRIINRLHEYWETLRGDRPFPIEDEIDPEALADIWDDCFLIHAYDIGKGSDYNYSFLGSNILRLKDMELPRTDTQPLASPSAETLAAHYDRVLRTRAPVIEQGCFVNTKGQVIRYRQCLLPFGRGDTVTAIFGGMRCKVYE